jgi:hypothetical protein
MNKTPSVLAEVFHNYLHSFQAYTETNLPYPTIFFPFQPCPALPCPIFPYLVLSDSTFTFTITGHLIMCNFSVDKESIE